MKMTKLALAIVVAGAASASIVGCHDGKDQPITPTTYSTTITVFDGYGLGCDVTVNGIAAEEDINGEYTLTTSQVLSDGAVINASNCTDADTNQALPTLRGVSQPGGAAVSPITTLIVAAAIAGGGDPANLSADAISTAKNKIVTNLNLGTYDPVNPVTANYVKNVNDADADGDTAKDLMKNALAITTLLKTLEKAADDQGISSDDVISVLAETVTNSTTTIDLGNVAEVQTLLSTAALAGDNEDIFDAITDTSTAVADVVAQIASADSIGEAAAITQVISEVIDNPDSTLSDVADTDTSDVTPIDVGVHTDPDTGETGVTGGSGA